MSNSYPANPRPGIPTNITVTPQTATIERGGTVQLSPVLTDAYGNPVTATQPFTYSSSNPSLVSVNASGLCTAAAGDPDVLETGGTVEIEIVYPWANEVSGGLIYAFVELTVTVPAGISVSLGNVTKNYPPA